MLICWSEYIENALSKIKDQVCIVVNPSDGIFRMEKMYMQIFSQMIWLIFTFEINFTMDTDFEWLKFYHENSVGWKKVKAALRLSLILSIIYPDWYVKL